MVKKVNIEKLLLAYDTARATAKESKDTADELNTAIKLALGDAEEVDTPTYICTYKFDKDKEVETFDAEKFEAKDPKGYKLFLETQDKLDALAKKYTKKTTVRGARKLIVTRKNEGEE